MHLSDNSTKVKLFMDVLDGTKAAVSSQDKTYFLVTHYVRFLVLFPCPLKLFLPLSAHDTHVCALSAPRIHDGHPPPRPPQAMEKVWIHTLDRDFQGFSKVAGNTWHILTPLFLLNLPICVASVVATAPDILSPLSLILECVLQADQQMMERTKAKIFSALISVLQIQGLNGKTCGSYVYSFF